MPENPPTPRTDDVLLPTLGGRSAAVSAWLGSFSRTLRTCRLYDAGNPNVVRFRAQLFEQLEKVLELDGAMRLEFSAQGVRCDDADVAGGQGHDEDFALPFFRDGLRMLAFSPGIEQPELDAVLDAVLHVTSRAANEAEDLVTLLWDANLAHVDMAYVSIEADLDRLLAESERYGDQPLELRHDAVSGFDGAMLGANIQPVITSGAEGLGDAMGRVEVELPRVSVEMVAPVDNEAVAPLDDTAADTTTERRRDDWISGEAAKALESAWTALDAASAAEAERFAAELREDRAVRPAPAMIALALDAAGSDLEAEDRKDVAALLSRTMLVAIEAGDWQAANAAFDALEPFADEQWEWQSRLAKLSNPESPVTAAVVRHLDASTQADLKVFADFGRRLGPAAIEWIMSIVAVSEQQRTRRLLTRLLGETCDGNPERLAPWLGDPRWYVARNAVCAIGAGTGRMPTRMFAHLVRHPDARVRQEVVGALAHAQPDDARPLLIAFLQDAEPSIRGAALHQLGQNRHPRAAEALLGIVMDAGFKRRPPEEVRAVTMALGGCASDTALPLLEDQLFSLGRFDRNAGAYGQAIARCIARIGTPAAIAVLQRGAESRQATTRDVCRLVLRGTGHA